jgi:hypothetical protein
VVLLLVVFASGVVVGVGLTVVGAVAQAQHNIKHPELQPARWTERLTRRLDLSPDESERVGRVLADAFLRVEAIRRSTYPEVTGELDRIEREVAEVLSEEKAERWRDYLKTLRRDWMPPPPGEPATQPAAGD